MKKNNLIQRLIVILQKREDMSGVVEAVHTETRFELFMVTFHTKIEDLVAVGVTDPFSLPQTISSSLTWGSFSNTEPVQDRTVLPASLIISPPPRFILWTLCWRGREWG